MIVCAPVNKMDEELIKQKNEIKMLQLQVQALISLLTKEGIVTTKEIEEQIAEIRREEE